MSHHTESFIRTPLMFSVYWRPSVWPVRPADFHTRWMFAVFMSWHWRLHRFFRKLVGLFYCCSVTCLMRRQKETDHGHFQGDFLSGGWIQSQLTFVVRWKMSEHDPPSKRVLKLPPSWSFIWSSVLRVWAWIFQQQQSMTLLKEKLHVLLCIYIWIQLIRIQGCVQERTPEDH